MTLLTAYRNKQLSNVKTPNASALSQHDSLLIQCCLPICFSRSWTIGEELRADKKALWSKYLFGLEMKESESIGIV